MVKVSILLVPPLLQPKFPELPLGVFTATAKVPGPPINVVLSVTCSWLLLLIVVVMLVPLMTTIEAETKFEPFTDRT